MIWFLIIGCGMNAYAIYQLIEALKILDKRTMEIKKWIDKRNEIPNHII